MAGSECALATRNANARRVAVRSIAWLDGSAKWSMTTKQIAESQNGKNDLEDEMDIRTDAKKSDESVFGSDQRSPENDASNKCRDDRENRRIKENLHPNHSSIAHGRVTI
jgi:hypothetical protein